MKIDRIEAAEAELQRAKVALRKARNRLVEAEVAVGAAKGRDLSHTPWAEHLTPPPGWVYSEGYLARELADE